MARSRRPGARAVSARIPARVKVGHALPAWRSRPTGLAACEAAFWGATRRSRQLPLVGWAPSRAGHVLRYATEETDKRKCAKAFQLYMNPEVMEEMLAKPNEPSSSGGRSWTSVLFSDIRGGTGISEKLSPAAAGPPAQRLPLPMTDIVFRGGARDQYIGER